MHSTRIARSVLALCLGAGFVALPSLARADNAPSSLCGGEKKKDVKKPQPDEKKKPVA